MVKEPNLKKIVLLYCLFFLFIFLAVLSNGALGYKVYANDTLTHDISVIASFLLNLDTNLTANDNINHTFEGKNAGATAIFNVEYVDGSRSGFLVKIEIDRGNSRMMSYSCDGSSKNTVCDGGCGGLDFANFYSFNVLFDGSANVAKVYAGGNFKGNVGFCPGISEIDAINFTGTSSSSQVKNNLVLADNIKPSFTGNLPNQTWPEDTSIGFNISGNFSDVNNDALTYSLEAGVDNISIDVNPATGIVNLTPDPDFFGIRHVRFIANDSDNITFSNNVT